MWGLVHMYALIHMCIGHIHMCIHAQAYTPLHVDIDIATHACISINAHMYLCMRTRRHLHDTHTVIAYINTPPRINRCAYAHRSTLHPHMYTHAHIDMQVCTYRHMHSNTQANAHTYKHTHLRTHKQVPKWYNTGSTSLYQLFKRTIALLCSFLASSVIVFPVGGCPIGFWIWLLIPTILVF